MTHHTRLIRCSMLLTGVLLAGAPHAFAQNTATALPAYRQSMSYLTTTVQQSNKVAAGDALLTVIAVHRSLTRALAIDQARLQAASRLTQLGETAVVTQLDEAELQRKAHILFVTNWIATDNLESRQAALDGAQKAIDDTEAAVTALAPLVNQIAGVTLPPALLLDVVVSRDANGTFLLLVDLQNLGGAAAERVTLQLRNGTSIGGDAQEIRLGQLPPGAAVQHVFAVALPAGTQVGTTSIEASAANATAETFAVDLDGTN